MPRHHLFNTVNLTAPPSTAAKTSLSLAGLLLFFTLAALLCAFHGRRRRWLTDRRRTKLIISTSQVQPGLGAPDCAGEDYEDDSSYKDDAECVWKKRIIMGGRCQFPDFSGAIAYDSDGNMLSPAPAVQLSSLFESSSCFMLAAILKSVDVCFRIKTEASEEPANIQ